MKTEAQGTSCDIQDLLFKLSGTGVELTPGLNSREDEWVLDDANPQKVNLKPRSHKHFNPLPVAYFFNPDSNPPLEVG